MTDLRLALRLCFRHPLLSLAAIASLALGIGANTAIFTVLNGSVLQAAGLRGSGQLDGGVGNARGYAEASGGAGELPRLATRDHGVQRRWPPSTISPRR